MLQGKLFINIKTNKIIIKYYKYSNNGYRNMMINNDFSTYRQIIVTTGLIKKILSKVSYNDNYFIGNLSFLDCIEPDDQYLNIVNQLNESNGKSKKVLIEKLNMEITELSTEKGSDIQSIEVVHRNKTSITRITLYSNGVLTADTEKYDTVELFISDILDGVINESD